MAQNTSRNPENTSTRLAKYTEPSRPRKNSLHWLKPVRFCGPCAEDHIFTLTVLAYPKQAPLPKKQRTLRFLNSFGAQNLSGKPDLECPALLCRTRTKTSTSHNTDTTWSQTLCARNVNWHENLHWGRPEDPWKPACKPTHKPPRKPPHKPPGKPPRKPPRNPPRKLPCKPPRKSSPQKQTISRGR